jgi:hypothetical protein
LGLWLQFGHADQVQQKSLWLWYRAAGEILILNIGNNRHVRITLGSEQLGMLSGLDNGHSLAVFTSQSKRSAQKKTGLSQMTSSGFQIPCSYNNIIVQIQIACNHISV